jgi:hypothetical protein
MAFNTMGDERTYQKHELEGVDWVPPPTLQVPESIKETGRKDIGKEEQDVGSPNDTGAEVEKAIDLGRWDSQDDSTDYGGWNSHDDPGNSRNWSFAKKVMHTAIPALYGFVM